MKSKKKIILAFIFIAATLLVNYIGEKGFINEMNQKAVSDKYPTLLTPLPIAFTIWGVIYLCLIITLFLLLFKSNEYWAAEATDTLALPFYFTSILNMAWIVVFSYEMLGLSAIITFLFAMTLAFICKRLSNLGNSKLFFPAFTFGIYAGWTLIATILNITAWLVQINWNGFGLSKELWSMIILVVAILITIIVAKTIKNAAFPLSAIWAYFQIWNAHNSPDGFAKAYPIIQWSALAGAVILIVLAVSIFLKNDKFIIPRKNTIR